MKIKDYKLFLESNSDMYIHSTCKQYGIKNYTISKDDKVDVDGDVDLRFKRLIKLPLKFGKVTGEFNCRSNYLYTLEGSPDWVGGLFSCSDNQLNSLEGCPKYVGHYFNCSFNKLKTLEGGPEVVIMDYNCENNELINFKGFPEYYEGTAYFNANPIDKILNRIPCIKYNKFIYWCNELNAIDDQGNINDEWMEEVYHKLDLEYIINPDGVLHNPLLESLKSNEEIDSICKKYRISNYTINKDGTVDVDGNVSILFNGLYAEDNWADSSYESLQKIPLKFKRVTGDFDCSYNELISLEGCPKWVGGCFDCSNNELKTLEGGPEIVIGEYICNTNKLINFKGFPEDYDGSLSIGTNPVRDKLNNVPPRKWNKFIYWCNEYEAIDDRGNINVEWMEEVYHKLGLKYED